MRVSRDRDTVPFETRLQRSRQFLADLRAAGFGVHVPTHEADQFRAAAWDAVPGVRGLADANGWDVIDRTHEPRDTAEEHEIVARILTAVAGCRPCPHLRRGSIEPGYALLALGQVRCRRCLLTVQNPPPEDARRCDWCRRYGVSQFRATGHQHGPLFVFGDACPDCAAVLCRVAA